MASKRHIRRKSCGKKKRHASEEAAMIEIMNLRRGNSLCGYLTAYRCPFCNGFHIGHPPAHVRRALSEKRMESFFKRRE